MNLLSKIHEEALSIDYNDEYYYTKIDNILLNPYIASETIDFLMSKKLDNFHKTLIAKHNNTSLNTLIELAKLDVIIISEVLIRSNDVNILKILLNSKYKYIKEQALKKLIDIKPLKSFE